ncbi:hypothetical protein C8Q74DRAFT_857818 [Fomes fomentarius]|nr:hypothetical protein C8Q74DRAFT_857818 [Fomes fomentarius]
MMCMHPAARAWIPVPLDFSFTFVFTVNAARALAIGIHIPKVRPADMARRPVHPPPRPQFPPPPRRSSRPVPLVSAPPPSQSQNISVVSLPPKAKPGPSFWRWRSAPPIIDDEADAVPKVTVRPALRAGMVRRPVPPRPPQVPPPPRSSRPVPLVSAPPLAQSQKVSVVSPPPMGMAKLEPSFRHWRSAPPIIDDDEADDSTNHNPKSKSNAAKHGVHEQDASAMDVDSANKDSRSDWRVSALAILLRQLSVQEGSSAIPFPYGIGIPGQRPAGTAAAGSVPASSGPGPDASSGSDSTSDSTSGSTSGSGSGAGTGTGAPSVPASSAPAARSPFSWAGGRLAWRLDEIVTKLTYWS